VKKRGATATFFLRFGNFSIYSGVSVFFAYREYFFLIFGKMGSENDIKSKSFENEKKRSAVAGTATFSIDFEKRRKTSS